MVQIRKSKSDSTLTISATGRLDTVTSADFEAELKASLDGIQELVLDFEELDYVSSAGLRVILAAHKQMAAAGGMTLRNVNDAIMEIFDMTGFSGILEIEGRGD